MTLTISDLNDGVEILLVKCRGFTQLDEAQVILIFKGKRELNRDSMRVLH